MPEIVASQGVNLATPKPVSQRSNFPLNFPYYQSMRFGEYIPHFVVDGVPNDKNLRLQSAHNIRSTSLKAPLMQDIMLKKDYFKVNMRAILPKNWDKIYVNPTMGDDVQAQYVNTVIEDFPSWCRTIVMAIYNKVTIYGDSSQIATDYKEYLECVLRFMLVSEYFYSQGSLLATLGTHESPNFIYDPNGNAGSAVHDYDSWYDLVMASLVNQIYGTSPSGKYFEFTSDGAHYYVYASKEDPAFRTVRAIGYANVTFREALAIMRENMDFEIVGYSGVTLTDYMTGFGYLMNSSYFTILNPSYPINLGRLYAYQIVCAHFYSNDQVDFIYSAELYRQLLSYYIREFFSGGGLSASDTFTLNGITHEYDWTAGYWLYKLSIGYVTSAQLSDWRATLGPWLRAVFGFNRSLRFMDYFTGSRSHPLAVGNVDVAVIGNKVNIVDVTQRTMVQKFLNAVNRGKRLFDEYIENIFPGTQVKKDAHDPEYLGHTTDVIFGSETENTGADQLTEGNSITTTLRSNASRFAFELDVNEPCIIIGLSYFDIERAYTRLIERQNMHVDRFDMFNPFMQFIGDQPVFDCERDASQPSSNYWGYQLRHMEYKQRVPQVSGALATPALKLWVFTDENYPHPANSSIDPLVIRSFPTELDQFFIGALGYSPATYYHFIVKTTNLCSASRPMAYAPSIL